MPSPKITTEVRLVHFNDVYHIPSVSHLARYIHLTDSFRSPTPGKHSNTFTIFSGHAFSQSLEASVLKGEHMIPILNRLRLMQLSGLRIVATWKNSEGSRVVTALIHSQNGEAEPIRPDQLYRVAMSSFIASGYDRYTSFPDQETIVAEEAAISDTTLMLEIFGHQTGCLDGNNRHRDGIERARQAVTVEQQIDGLVVEPATDGRITFIES